MEISIPKMRTAAARLTYGLTVMCLVLLCVSASSAGAPTEVHPLAPVNTSSPRATLKTFLDDMNDAVKAYKEGRREEARRLAKRAAGCLNLEKEPPALRNVLGFYAILYLKELWIV